MQARQYFLGENDRIKLLVVYAGTSMEPSPDATASLYENEMLMRAAAGALCTLTNTEVWEGALECCQKVTQVSSLHLVFSFWLIGIYSPLLETKRSISCASNFLLFQCLEFILIFL